MTDYDSEEEFGDIYCYADSGELTGNTRRDKTILIMADRYLIDKDGLLYRMDMPQDKKLAKLKAIVERLYVPLRHNIVKYAHEQNGQGLFHTLAIRFYWKSLYRCL